MASELFSSDLNAHSSHDSNGSLNTSALSDGTSKHARSEMQRTLYLERIVQALTPPVVVLSGQSSSGKSTILGTLKDSGFEAATRLMPRPTRAGDAAGDRPWTAKQNSEQKPWLDNLDPASVMFSHYLYTGFYGFPAKDIVRQIKAGHGSVCIVGRCVEIPPLIESIRDLFPLIPVVPIKLDVPLSVLESRLRKRPEAFPGEVDQRLAALKEHQQGDSPHVPALCISYGLRQIVNVDADEMRECGFSPDQVRPTTPELVREVVAQHISECQAKSAVIAKDILTPRTINYGHKYIPDALLDVLENKLAPHADAFGVPVCIKGGLAVALYLEHSRPVSLDIDFTAPESMRPETRMGAMLKELHGREVDCKDAWNKRVYHVRGYSSSYLSERYQKDVELDALAITRVQPGNEGFCFEFHFDAHDFFHRRTVSLPNGKEVYLVPPEQIVIEKLAAGRGPELGKFDLFDVAGILASLPIDPALVRKMLDGHLFDPKIDFDVEARLRPLLPLTIPAALEALNLRSDWLKFEPHFQNSRFSDWTIPKGQSSREASIHALKKIALCLHLDRAICAIESQLDHPWVVGDEQVTIRNYFDMEKMIPALKCLKSQIRSFANFEAGRADVFVRRSFTSADERSHFFADLSAQRERLSAGLADI